MKKIKRPDWVNFIYPTCVKNLNRWFDENLGEGKYVIDESDLVEVRDSLDSGELTYEATWRQGYCRDISTHKAYLIKSSIEPIVKETEIDLLKQFVEIYPNFDTSLEVVYKKAKALLGES